MKRLLAHIENDEAPSPWLLPLVVGPALLFGVSVFLRRLAYESRFLRVHQLRRPVISVGNLRVGGGGKTPFTRLLTREIAATGRRVGVLSRGYGRIARHERPLVVSHGQGPLTAVEEAGDEPFLMASETEAIVVVSRDRVRGANLAIDLGAEILVLDDGFQHLRVHRDLDILMLDAFRPFATGRLLPWGSLREGPRAIGRAGLIVLNHGVRSPGAWVEGPDMSRTVAVDASRMTEMFERARRDGTKRVAVVEVETVPVGLRTIGRRGPRVSATDTESVWRAPGELFGARVALFSAIARPVQFEATVRALGASVLLHHRERDHAWPSSATIDRFLREGRRKGATRFLTTEKDAVRLEGMGEIPVECLAIEHRILGTRLPFEGVLRNVLEGPSDGGGDSPT